MNSEVIARINSHGVDLNAVGRGTATITKEEIAAALSCATNVKKARMMAMVAYALYLEDENAKQDLKNYLAFCHIDNGYRTGKKDKGKDRMRKVCEMAVQAFCMRGTDGKLSDRKVAERLSIPQSTWRGCWCEWYRKSLTLLSDLELTLEKHMEARL